MKREPLTCVICTAHVNLERGGRFIGTVNDLAGEPSLKILPDHYGLVELTFNEIEIIMDCWNAMKETQAKEQVLYAN